MPLDMKKIFLFIMISYCCIAQTDDVCDSISITINDYDLINNTINLQVNMEYNSSYVFPYAGFMITNENNETIASFKRITRDQHVVCSLQGALADKSLQQLRDRSAHAVSNYDTCAWTPN